MELYIYDTEMTLLGVMDMLTSLVWTRRYWSCGEFKLLAPFTENHVRLLQKGRLVMKRGDDEAGQIQYVHINKNGNGLEEIEVQGKFLLSWLGKRIVREQIIAAATAQDILYRIVRENAVSPTDESRAIPNLLLSASDGVLGTKTINYTSEAFINAQLACEDAAKAAALGLRVRTDRKARKHSFSVYQGRNLTIDQSAEPPCVFSQEYDNITEQEYTNSVENLKTTAYVGGEEKSGVQRQIAAVGGEYSGLNRAEVFVNATDIVHSYKDKESGNEITLTDAEYLAALEARGGTELQQYAETLGFASTINTHGNLKYREDYDVGDRVTCINKRWGIKINVRITEVTETYQAGKEDIDVTFGESLPALIDKLRQAMKG